MTSAARNAPGSIGSRSGGVARDDGGRVGNSFECGLERKRFDFANYDNC